MKRLSNYITEKLKIKNETDPYLYHPKSRNELIKIIANLMKEHGKEVDLNVVDVSQITDMINIFSQSQFNGDISNWDVSNVKDMYAMFNSSKFNKDISRWNVTKLEDKCEMFTNCPLQNNPPAWYKNK